MTPEQFAYWLQGYSEVAQEAPSAAQWQIIQDHLSTVFTKVTPIRNLADKLRPIDDSYPKPMIDPKLWKNATLMDLRPKPFREDLDLETPIC